jgi:hypothetical protein
MKQITINILSIICLLCTVACSDSERRLGISRATSTVVINLNTPVLHASLDRSITDRILSFFTPRDAMAQTAPAVFSTITVRISGADIGIIEKNFISVSTISFTVPSGDLRRFDITANVASGDPSAAVSFRGTAIANLPAGVTVNVPVVMKLNETKIIAPDLFNQRIVIKETMHSGWNVITTFSQPMDIDFDSKGRIYIVDQNLYYVWRLENINDSSPVQISTIDWLFLVTVDRNNDRIFYSDNSSLWQNDLNGTNESAKNLVTAPYSITSINSMDVAPDGMIYIAGQVNNSGITLDAIIKYDPEANSGAGAMIATTYNSAEINSYLSNPTDIQVKWPYLYIINSSGVNNYKILQLTIDSGNNFTISGHYGTQATAGTDLTPGAFYGPTKFVSLRNDGLIIMDSMIGYSRLVHINDDLMSGWDTVGGANGSGTDQFNF